MPRLAFVLASVLVGAVAAGGAGAHVTLRTQKAPAGSLYEAVFAVEHGCSGSPTVRVRVRIPAGVGEVTPLPKPGWQVSVVPAQPAAPSADAQGGSAGEDVREVVWSGGRLPADRQDTFVLRLRLPDTPGAVIYFPLVQECETGVHRWIDIPEPGAGAADLDEPAPRLTLTPRPR